MKQYMDKLKLLFHGVNEWICVLPKELWPCLFERARMQHLRGNSQKLYKQIAIRTCRAKFFFSQMVIEGWIKLPDEVITAPSVQTFKDRLDKHWARYRHYNHHYLCSLLICNCKWTRFKGRKRRDKRGREWRCHFSRLLQFVSRDPVNGVRKNYHLIKNTICDKSVRILFDYANIATFRFLAFWHNPSASERFCEGDTTPAPIPISHTTST
jgi:hypothetical protein